MPWDDGIEWGIDDPLYTDDPYANWGGGAGGDGSEPFNPDDPYANWGGGPGGDGTSGGDDTGGGFNVGGLDLSKLLGAGGSAAGNLLKSLGIIGKDGSIDLGALLSLGGIIGGGISANNATGKASAQMQEAANKANDLAASTINGASANFKPYIDAGAQAVGKMASFDTSPLGAKYVAQGTPSNLAAKFSSAPITLGAIAARR